MPPSLTRERVIFFNIEFIEIRFSQKFNFRSRLRGREVFWQYGTFNLQDILPYITKLSSNTTKWQTELNYTIAYEAHARVHHEDANPTPTAPDLPIAITTSTKLPPKH